MNPAVLNVGAVPNLHEARVEGGGSISAISLQEVSDLETLESLRAAWCALAGRLGNPSPFLLPQFLLPQIRWVKDQYAFRVLGAWLGGDLVGLAPLFEREVGKWGVHIRTLTFPVYGTSPPFDLLVDPGNETVVDQFKEAWEGRGDWDLLELENICADSTSYELLRSSRSGSGMRLVTAAGRSGCYAAVEGTWDEYLRSRSKHLRSNYKRAWTRCQAAGATQVVRFPQDGLRLEEALAHVETVLDRSWKRPGSGGFSVRHLIRDLAHELHRDRLLSIRLVMVGGRPVCYLFEIDYRKRLTAYHTAYALEAQDLWPGVVVIGDGVRDAHERGYERYDFGGEARVYLASWATHTSGHLRIRLLSPRLSSRLKVPLFDLLRSRRKARARHRSETRKQLMKERTP
jgi:CelD/BcsL family acetyltransferase involved in cellulose biosynthesis